MLSYPSEYDWSIDSLIEWLIDWSINYSLIDCDSQESEARFAMMGIDGIYNPIGTAMWDDIVMTTV